MRSPRVATILLAVACLDAAPLAAAQEATARFEGRSLQEALAILEGDGLDLIYSSDLVPATARVESEPASGSPREVLEALLAPHGLEARDGPGRAILVVQRGSRVDGGRISGRVTDASDGDALPGVQLRLVGGRHEFRSDGRGRFKIPGLTPGVYTLMAELPGYAPYRAGGLRLGFTDTLMVEVELTPTPIPLAEIVVHPSRFAVLSNVAVTRQGLTRAEVERLPHLSDDSFRAVRRLPGASSGDIAAPFHVRGGEADELLVLIDGLEVYEPFHLKDFQRVFSLIDSRAIGSIDFLTGGYSVKYGDRMSGVLDIRSVTPADAAQTSFGISFVNAHAVSEGRFGERGAGQWLVAARRGYLDIILEFVDPDSEFDPHYYDILGKLGYDFENGVSLTGHVLVANDDVTFEDGVEVALAEYGSLYAWATIDGAFSDRARTQTVVSAGNVDRNRKGGDDVTSASDVRSFDVFGLKHEIDLALTDRDHLFLGIDAKWLDADYDYERVTVVDPASLIPGFDPPQGVTGTSREPVAIDENLAVSGATYGAYISNRTRLLDPLAIELGLRWDRQTYLEDADQWSPRVGLLMQLGERSSIRASWGRFHQSQRINELQIEDGVTTYSPAERSDHMLVGLDHEFVNGVDLRVETYRKRFRQMRPRFENLFDALELWPEGRADRVRIAPRSADARGIELTLRGEPGRRVEWWIGYAYSRVEDRLEGVDLKRRWDQPHAVNYSVNVGVGSDWNLNFAGVHRSGWPTTRVTAVTQSTESGEEILPVFGPLYGDRFDAYHRIDLRLSREIRVGAGNLRFYLELLNLLDADNSCCIEDFEFLSTPRGVDVFAEKEGYIPRAPSFGVTWTLGG